MPQIQFYATKEDLTLLFENMFSELGLIAYEMYSDFGEPFVLDLSAVQNGDAPVLTAKHGQGTWKFRKVASTFLEFLQKKIAQV